VNHGNATGEQIFQLSQRIRMAVFERAMDMGPGVLDCAQGALGIAL